ncbi:hypothetical protein ACWEOW_09450 [Monashia sp. NPDC004114]
MARGVRQHSLSGATLRRRRRAALGGAVAVGLVAASTLTVPAAQAATSTLHVTLGVAAGHAGDAVVKQTNRTDGYTIASAVKGNVEVRTSAPTGSTSDVTTISTDDGKSGSVLSTVTTPDTKLSGVDR